jgi:hypothetical protein
MKEISYEIVVNAFLFMTLFISSLSSAMIARLDKFKA